MTDKTENDEKEIIESQKLSERDKKQIQDGACVNCALVSFIVTFIMTLVFLL